MSAYLVIYEHGRDGGWGAYVPDLPGIAVGAESREQAAELIREAIHLYLEELAEDGMPAPPAASTAERIHVAA